MQAYIVRRLLQVFPVVALSSVLVFLMIHLVPGDPAMVYLGADATEQQLEAVRREMGLDKPLYSQYLIWLGRVLRGNLGVSLVNHYPVSGLILSKLPVTIQLTLGAFIVSACISIPMGIISAIKRRSIIDYFFSGFTALGLGIPVFWLGILLVLFFAVGLGWLPSSGYVSPLSNPVQGVRHWILPWLTLGVSISAVQARYMKTSILETLGAEYVRTARSKGLDERAVIFRHVLKNALIPVVTIVGLQLGQLLGGAVIVETVFGLPGLGYMVVHSILARDYVAVQGLLLLVVVTFALMNLLTDIIYVFIDPRIRYQ